MKALAIVVALFLVALPIAAGPIDLPVPNLLDRVYGWFTAVWEAMGPMIVPSGQPDEMVQRLPQQEMGPMIIPSGQPNGQ